MIKRHQFNNYGQSEIELLAQSESELDAQINEYIKEGYKLISKKYDYEVLRIPYIGVFGPRDTYKTRIRADIWRATMELRF